MPSPDHPSHREPVRVLIVEDEPPARDRLRRLIGGVNGLIIVGLAETGREAVQAIESEHPDLVLLDVQMPGLDAFGVIAGVGVDRMPLTIFVTAFDDYAVRAFEAQALDYVLKPFDDERVLRAIERARERLAVETMRELGERFRALLHLHGAAAVPSVPAGSATPRYLDRIAVRAGDRTVLVPVASIDWIEGARKQVRLHAGRDAFLARIPMHELEVRLDPRWFVRIHKSTIVRVDRIRELLDHLHGDYLVVLHDGARLRMSRSRRTDLEARLGQSL
ncbi:MAG: two component transcriptional regulator, LytTR family [Gemmatimonadetes bacterium]|nr:two component transcriptional regulator, LytTR family [Gemmatimonadota bacterium]